VQALSISPQQKSLVARLRGLELDAAERAREVAKQHEREQMAAAGRNIMHELDVLAQKAGAAAAASKMYRSWEPAVGEFDALPQLPQKGQVLKYFASEEGIKALRSDALQRNSGVQEYERLQERLRNMPPSLHFAEQGIYGVLDHITGPDDLSDERCHDETAQEGTEEITSHHKLGMQQELQPQDAAEPPEQNFTDTVLEKNDQGCLQSMGKGSTRVKLPKIYRQPKANTVLNDEYLKREYMTKRLVRTSAAELIRARGRDDVEFELGCEVLDFGEVQVGAAPIVRKIPLQNVSLERSRFSVDHIEPPLKVTYQKGPVPAGLKTYLTVEFSATDVGNYQGEIVVRSPVNLMKCRVCAVVNKS
jgi:hypothetical protein